MTLSTFQLASTAFVLLLAIYIILYRSNLRILRLEFHSSAKDALDERESLVWFVGTVILALSQAARFLLEGMNSMTSMLNALLFGMAGFATLLWIWVIAKLVGSWLKRRHVPKRNTKTAKAGVP